jgi:hypothetical protein
MYDNLPSGITSFRDNDQGFFDWLDRNPTGYFVKVSRSKSKPSYVHFSECSNYDRSANASWTRTVKVCSNDLDVLERWARSMIDGDVKRCQSRSCFGGTSS